MRGISRMLLIAAALSLLLVPIAAQDNELEANKALALAWWEAETAREYDRMGEFFTEDVVRHSVATATVMPEVQVTDLDAYAQFLQATAEMLPDYRFTPQMLAAEGDYVAWYGVFSGTFAENGNSLEVPFAGLFRYEEGKVAEVWTEWDNVTWGGQMYEGAPPPPIAGYEPPVTTQFDLEANKALVTAFAEAELTRNYDRLDELIAADFVRHSSATPDVQVDNREAFKAFLQATAEQFPDYSNTAQVMVAEGDLVALYTSMAGTFAPTGLAVEFPHLDFFRIEDGKIAELWVEWDNLSLMMQMGVLPPPAAEMPPVGTYTTTITEADIADYPTESDLAGSVWLIEITADGLVRFEARGLGEEAVRFRDRVAYSATTDTLLLGGESGPYGDCSAAYNVTSATYSWTWSGEELNVVSVEDRCTPRRIVLTSHPLLPVFEPEMP